LHQDLSQASVAQEPIYGRVFEPRECPRLCISAVDCTVRARSWKGNQCPKEHRSSLPATILCSCGIPGNWRSGPEAVQMAVLGGRTRYERIWHIRVACPFWQPCNCSTGSCITTCYCLILLFQVPEPCASPLQRWQGASLPEWISSEQELGMNHDPAFKRLKTC